MAAAIWLIEDNEAFREATRLYLEMQPERFSWRAFESCEEALTAMEQGGKPEVMLLDVDLPGMDGITGIKHFRKHCPEVSILILTVFEADDKIFRAICAGASGYLLKSEPFQNIIAAIEQALAGGAPMNPHIARRVITMFSEMAPPEEDYGLTEVEQKILQLMGQGLAKKQISDELAINPHTLNSMIRRIYRKLHVNCQAAAVSVANRSRSATK